MSTLKNEPVIVAVLAWVTATIALVVAFGVHVTPEQREAIEAWVGATIVGGLLVRSRVVPLLKHKAPAAPAPTPEVTPAPASADVPVRP